MVNIVLASSSTYRKRLLERLQLSFISDAPAVDESPRPEESARALVTRLSRQKAQTVAARYKQHLVIASDQVADLEGHILTKPGNLPSAREQLSACSGKRVTFYTGLCVMTPDGALLDHIDLTEVHFKTLNPRHIDSYLRREEPYDCAGSFKCEGLGIALFERISSDDPTALEGLPLIALCKLLEQFDIGPLG